MCGDDTKRFCSGCQKNVFHISAMKADEAEKLLADNPNGICVRYSMDETGAAEFTDRRIRLGKFALLAGLLAATLQALGFQQGSSKKAVTGTPPANPPVQNKAAIMGEMVVPIKQKLQGLVAQPSKPTKVKRPQKGQIIGKIVIKKPKTPKRSK